MTTSSWWATYASSADFKLSVLGRPFTRATILTPKLVWSGVNLYRLLSTTLALASRFRGMTIFVSSPAERSCMSRIPSSSRLFTSSAMRSWIARGLA